MIEFVLPMAAQTAPEVIDRVPGGFHPFVLPFVIGIVFALTWMIVGLVRIISDLDWKDRKALAVSLVTPKTALKNIKDIFCDCLFHTKIWQRKPLLGYMHSAIAFGWFLLIILGHLEVLFFVPKHLNFREGSLFYPIFYRYFVWANPGHETLRGSLFLFLMDLCLLYVLSGIGLAVFKRFRSRVLGMKHTTRPSFVDRIVLYSLWGIFPLRLMAESFTAGLSGGSFLTLPINMMLQAVFGENLHILPWWWAYSICLALFFIGMPFSRYTHILTEPLLILMRNAGIRTSHPRKGYTEAEIYACSSCGLCIDACPMNVQKKNLRFSSVYFNRFMRRHNDKKIKRIADKCLQCGKCLALCPVGVDSPAIRRYQRARTNDMLPFNYDYMRRPEIAAVPPFTLATAFAGPSSGVPASGMSRTASVSGGPSRMSSGSSGVPVSGTSLAASVSGGPDAGNGAQKAEVLYFAGCMSHLTPKIIKSVETVLSKAGVNYIFADREGGICCGRPLMLAGKFTAAKNAIEANRRMILHSGCKILLVSCPICLKVFKEEYDLEDIEILHYTEFIDRLVAQGRLRLTHSDASFVYHDPCELGRGCGIYNEPRRIISGIGELKKASKERDESVCCGGSLGSITLDYHDRTKITEGSIETLMVGSPDNIVTACPLCYKTFRDKAPVPVLDIAELVAGNSE